MSSYTYILYQRKNIISNENIGEPANLPQELVGLEQESLNDLSLAIPYAVEELGYKDQGFFPVTMTQIKPIPNPDLLA